MLAALGFRALATTSSGFAFTLGRRRRGRRLDRGLGPRRLHLSARAGGRSRRRAVAAARSLAFPFTLTARAENHIRGNPDLDDTIARLRAYERAGADVLYAPGLRSADEIRAVCAAVDRPVNVLAHRGLSMRAIADAGAQRVSVGGALAWTAVEAMADATAAIRDAGDFTSLGSYARIQGWLGA